MQNIQKIEQEIEIATSVKSLAVAYEEISIMKMKKIRDVVLNMRFYLDNLYPVFKEVRKIYVETNMTKKSLLMLKEEDDLSKNFSTIKKNGKTVIVLITPNSRMSGNLTKAVISHFLDDLPESAKGKNIDYVIIGKIGASLIRGTYTKLNNKNVLFFDFPSMKSETEILRIVQSIMKYDKVLVYYGKFKNLIQKVSTKDEISAEYENVNPKEMMKSDFIVEPDVGHILNFFELQVFSVLFKQRLSESELGMLGSRISAMEAAITKSDQKYNQLISQRRTYRKKEDQRKQIQRVVSASLSIS